MNYSTFWSACLPLVLLLSFLAATSAGAIQLSAGQSVTVSEARSIEGSYLVAGQSITIEGRISGDLYCAGQTIRILGSVGGDVLCAGQTIIIDGSVQGDVRVLGQELSVLKTIGQNLTVLVQTLSLQSKASVAGELIGGAQQMSLNGDLDGDVLARAEEISLNGRVNGDVSVTSHEFLLGRKAAIAGNLEYSSRKKLSPESLDRVTGSTRYTPPTAPTPTGSETDGTWDWVWWLAGWLYSLISFFVMGLLFLILWPGGAAESVRAIHEGPGITLAWGLVMIAVPPVLAILLMLTFVGVPLAVVLVLFWVCLLLLSPVLTGVAFGDWILNFLWKGRPLRLYAALALGVTVLWLFFAIPYLGTLLYILATMLGLGGLFQSLRIMRRTTPAATEGSFAVEPTEQESEAPPDDY